MSNLMSKMPWGHGEKKEETKQEEEEEGESLTTILTNEEDRSALTILIGECAESMRESINDIFDATHTGTKDDLVADLEKNLNLDELDDKQREKAKKDREQAEEQMEKELKQRQKELSSEKFQELQKAALSDFDAWVSDVILRVGEIVNSREMAEAQKKQADATKEEKPPLPRRNPESSGYDKGVDAAYQQLYPPIKTRLLDLPQEKRALILHSLLLLLLSLEHYHSYSRTLLVRISTSLDLSISFLAHDESRVAKGLLAAAENMNANDETQKKADDNKVARRWKVGLATAAGATLIGVTGGLAAPLLAAGIGSVMGGLGLASTAGAAYLGTLAGSSVLVGGLFGAYGGRMTGQMMDQYAREVEDFAFVPIKGSQNPRKIRKEDRRLRVGIGISGWLRNENEVVEPWKVIGNQMESFALRWELEALINLGNSLTTMMTSAAFSVAKSQIIKHTVFAALTAGLWPLALVKVSRIIENPWSVASYRAQKAGEVLADAIINKAQGERPVTLIGYSLGAKVIFACLRSLAERKAFGLIENAVFMGAPTPSTPADWRLIRSVVSGRVVNVFSTNDYILAFLYRSSSITYGVAGLQQVHNVKGVENVDVSKEVSGHTNYRFLTGPILKKIGFEDIDAEELEKEEKQLKEETDKQAADEAKAKAAGGEGQEVSDQQVQDLQDEVDKKNENAFVGWTKNTWNAAGQKSSNAIGKMKGEWNSRNDPKGKEKGKPGGQAVADSATTAVAGGLTVLP